MKTARHPLLALAFAVVFAAVTYAQQQDFSKVEIKTTKLGGNVYQLEGRAATSACWRALMAC